MEKLKSCDFGLVFGGDPNDCICTNLNHYTNRFTMRGHHDIENDDACKGKCCVGRFQYSYKYKDEEEKFCRSSNKPDFEPEWTRDRLSFPVIYPIFK